LSWCCNRYGEVAAASRLGMPPSSPVDGRGTDAE
jgi:hypothetical protein